MKIASLSQIYINRAIALLAGVCALSVFLYATFLLLTVTHAASQTAIESQIQGLSAQVGDMETQYLVATKGITPDKALALGFTTPTDVSTVFATAGALSLSLR
jgi:hypothetical protein